ncbi:hypothetical protein GQ44DRAFT_742513 [Phaeosphaeriaceae sp. PMI808]|nr:hypothetical protein GQ44DRAFT_742513 [Phaeosphaeriaceae sp. PMI808]
MEDPQSSQPFHWAHDAFVALNDPNMQNPKRWAALQNSPFTIPPSLLTRASIERYGQITPPENFSPADPDGNIREGSIPVEQLRNEAPWPQQHQPSLQSLQQHSTKDTSPKLRRTSRQAASHHTQADDANPPEHNANPQPPKRKRGRPKSQPQMVDVYTADGLPFKVSSARHTHLEKNRVAAHKCRQRKKEYINGLEGRARVFSAKNKALKENVAILREEVLSLKNEVLRHAGCNFWAVDEYLARCAGDLLGMDAPASTSRAEIPTHQDPAVNTQQVIGQRHDSIGSLPSQMADGSSPESGDDFLGLELLRNFEDDDMEDQS